MGASVSASAVILLAAAVVAGVAFYETLDESYRVRNEALDEHYEMLAIRSSTGASIDNVTHNVTSSQLWVVLTNTGSTTMDLDKCQLMVNGTLIAPSSVTFTEKGTAVTTFYPGSVVTAATSFGSDVTRVGFVSEYGPEAYSSDIHTIT